MKRREDADNDRERGKGLRRVTLKLDMEELRKRDKKKEKAIKRAIGRVQQDDRGTSGREEKRTCHSSKSGATDYQRRNGCPGKARVER